MKSILAATLVTAGLAALTVAPAHAAVMYSNTFNITAYHLTNPNASPSIGDATVQALPSAIAAATPASRTALGSFTYVGALNFALDQSGTDTLAAFIASGGGTVTAGTVPTIAPLSHGNFTDSTLLKISFSLATSANVTFSNDDGISLFTAGNTSSDLLPIGRAAPTTVNPYNYTIAAGSYDLYYAEVNGLPAQLNVVLNSVPEPASMALLGLGLIGAGVARRKSNA